MKLFSCEHFVASLKELWFVEPLALLSHCMGLLERIPPTFHFLCAVWLLVYMEYHALHVLRAYFW